MFAASNACTELMALSPNNQSLSCSCIKAMTHLFTYIYRSKLLRHLHYITKKAFLSTIPRTKNNQAATMINPKKLAQMAWKWQRVKTATRDDEACCTILPVADKDHCTVYTADGRRFEVPLAYLSSMAFSELLRMSEEEFGFTGNGRITLPCAAAVVEYMICLLRRNASEEVEKAFLSSVVMPCQHLSSTMPPVVLHQQFAVCSS